METNNRFERFHYWPWKVVLGRIIALLVVLEYREFVVSSSYLSRVNVPLIIFNIFRPQSMCSCNAMFEIALVLLDNERHPIVGALQWMHSTHADAFHLALLGECQTSKI